MLIKNVTTLIMLHIWVHYKIIHTLYPNKQTNKQTNNNCYGHKTGFFLSLLQTHLIPPFIYTNCYIR